MSRRATTLVLVAVAVVCGTTAAASYVQGRHGPTAAPSITAAPALSPTGASPTGATGSTAAPPALATVPAAAGDAPFTFAVGDPAPSARQCALPVPVTALAARPDQPIVLGEPANSTDWCDTSVWLDNPAVGWTYPSSPSRGITFVALHACHAHACPLTFFQCQTHCTEQSAGQQMFTLAAGAQATITTPTGVLTYEVCALGVSPKGGSLRVPTGCNHVDLVFGTCSYPSQTDNDSTANVVAAATLVAARPR